MGGVGPDTVYSDERTSTYTCTTTLESTHNMHCALLVLAICSQSLQIVHRVQKAPLRSNVVSETSVQKYRNIDTNLINKI